MKDELATKLMDLQKRLLETNDSQGLMLFDALRQEIQRDEQYERIAVWLADCQAATAEDYASRKSAPKGERTRHASICKRVRQMIESGMYTGDDHYRPFDEIKKRVLERLDEAESKCIGANV